MPEVLLAHGLGGRSDLPVDAASAAWAAAIIVGASFLLAIAFRSHAQQEAAEGSTPLPRRLAWLGNSKALTVALQAVVFFLTALVVAVAFLGPDESRFNLAPYTLYVVFWAGIVPASLLFGPIWRRVNPLRLLHQGISRATGVAAEDGALGRLSPKVGMWPAAAWLLLFVWLELVYPDRAEPGVVGLFLVLYIVVTVNMALLYGSAWFDGGDGFEVYSTVIGSLAPVGRNADNTLVWRSPLRGLALLRPVPGLTAVVAVLIGSTGFDGLTRTQFWQRNVPPTSVPLGTLGLLALIAAVWILFVVAVYAGGYLAGVSGAGSGLSLAQLPGLFAPSLVPIAVGYAVAHYFSFLLFEGQVALALISDPFGLGRDLFGTAQRRVDYLLIGTTTIAMVQLYAIVIGHIVGVLAAHDTAVSLLRERRRVLRSQWPLALVMVGITLCGVLLLLSA